MPAAKHTGRCYSVACTERELGFAKESGSPEAEAELSRGVEAMNQ